jgi:hypothetical protein
MHHPLLALPPTLGYLILHLLGQDLNLAMLLESAHPKIGHQYAPSTTRPSSHSQISNSTFAWSGLESRDALEVGTSLVRT